MNELQQELFEKQLLSIAKGMEYPPTPDLAGAVQTRLRVSTRPRFISRPFVSAPSARTSQGRHLAWSLTILLILFASLMVIPPARAAIIEFIQIGVVRIFRGEPTPVSPPNQEFPSTMTPVTATPGPTPQSLLPLLERLAGEMTLAEAQLAVDYPLLLPSYPSDLGQPDRIFVQEADGAMAILVWMDHQQPDQVFMSLHFLPAGSWAINKMGPEIIQETTVNGRRAVWAVGPYPMRFSNGNLDFIRLIDGHVLIWADGDVTYRLETDLSMEEAIKIAELLEPVR